MKLKVMMLAVAANVCALGGGTAEAAESHDLTVEPGGMTPHQAQAKIRAAKAAGDKGMWTVRVKPGCYVLPETLVFTPADSGTPKAPVRWIGEGEKCVFSGGGPLKVWKDEGGGVWSAELPKGKGGRPVYFEQLWVNGRRAERARLPNTGHWKIKQPSCKEVKDSSGSRYVESFALGEKDAAQLGKVPADELAYVQMCVVHKWSFARRILRGFDADKFIVTVHSPAPWVGGWQNWNSRETLVCFENVRSAFDAPGEWFFDAQAGKVLYRPLEGERMSETTVLAPTSKLSKLVEIKGDPGKGEYVHDIVFSGLAFECTDSATILTDVVANHTKGTFTPPADGPTESWQYQAAQSADAAITAEGAQRIVWDACRVRHTANYALRFNDGCTYNRVFNCTLEDLGAGGVWMGARKGYVPPGEGTEMARRVYHRIGPRSTAFNHISNCTIRAGGRFNPEGTGVAITHASECSVKHCDIHDIYYTGVSVGWTWGFTGSVAQRNEIAYNRIYDLGKGVMSDMGGVYTLGTSYGSKVHDNVIHDVKSFSYGGWALYTDEGSEGIVMERNLCWNTTDGGFHQHYGAGCIIRNNIFAWNRTRGAVRMERGEVQNVPCTLHFINNIVLVREGSLVGKGPRRVGGVWANNLWWDVSGSATFDGLKWDEWKNCGKETNGMYADPLFEDAEKFDFRLKGESPAFKLGFKAWDYEKAGKGK